MSGWRLCAHYYFGGGEQVQVWCQGRRIKVREPSGLCPSHPEYGGSRMPHPAEEDGDSEILSYEEIGLFYDYAMPETGWDGDC